MPDKPVTAQRRKQTIKKSDIKNAYNKNTKVKINLEKPNYYDTLVGWFSSICLLSMKRGEGHLLFLHKMFPTFIHIY